MITARGNDSPSLSDHLSEIGEILAAGLMRAAARKSSEISTETGESSLDFPAAESGHQTDADRRKSDG